MSKLIFTSLPWPEKARTDQETPGGLLHLAAVEEEGRITELFPLHRGEVLTGRVYVGQIDRVAENLNAAFVTLAPGLQGYLPLQHQEKIIRADGRDTSITENPRPLKAGNCVLVQVEREAMKGKLPRLTGALSFSGRLMVAHCRDTGLSLSSKLSRDMREVMTRRMKKLLAERWGSEPLPFGLILRTNAEEASNEELASELASLEELYRKVTLEGRHRTPGSLLYKPLPQAARILRDLRQAELSEVITDDQALYEELKELLGERAGLLRLYEDSLLPLASLKRLPKVLEDALKEKVWLPGGGFLVIQQTEAFVSIDVNTGKYTGNKKAQEAFRKTNLEAAAEIAAQLRLRSLSGIILIDFINLENPDHRQELMDVLRKQVRRDPVKCQVVDLTALGILEMTRRKVRPTLAEEIKKPLDGGLSE